MRRISLTLAILIAVYFGMGLAFRFKWQGALAACREIRQVQGEFVETEVLGGPLSLVFDITCWPVYSWANMHHDGTPFATLCTHPTRQSTSGEDEGIIRYLVESFGKKLQYVPLQSPNVAQEIQKQYSEFVSPVLLETWLKDVSKAPGRVVSSPWPDHIEITTFTKDAADKYTITGFVIEVTSVEVLSGGAAAKIPVHIVVRKEQGRWLITEYAEQRPAIQ